MKRKRNVCLLIVVVLVLGAAGFFTSKYLGSHDKAAQTPAKRTQSGQKSQKTPPKKTTLRLIAAGDMLPHDALNQAAKTANGYDYLQFMKNLQPYFKRADVRFCVQAVPAGGEAYGISGYPVFNAPVEFTRDMTRLGCNVVTTGTNHSNDKGQPLINANLEVWDKQPGILAEAGSNRTPEEQNKMHYFEKDGIKFAFLAYTTYNNTHNGTSYGVNMWDEATAARELAAAEQNADITLVSIRWGTEYSPDINPSEARFAQFLADHGADVVFGHGQHVQGPVKRLAKKGGGETIVWYGIGNFVNAQLPPEALFNGIPVVDIDIASKKVSSLSFLPFYMHYEWTPEQKAREDLLARKNFMMYTLDQAAAPLARSQNNTTLAAQKQRLQTVLNQFTPVKILEPNQY